MKRGEVWLADLGPVRNGEQAGRRPVLVLEKDMYIGLWRTVVVVPFSGNLRRATRPTCIRVSKGEGGLANDSVALCHQIQAVDQKRLLHRLGTLSASALTDIVDCVVLTLEI